MPAGTRRVHVFLTGRVQGVGFRAFTQREARRLGLTGWVKNLADGRVEAVAEGPASKVEALLAKIRRGPRAARVEKLESRDEEPTGEFRQFEIRY
ncbi:MAG: acylphosphatase [Candidatus Brocadiia bacterium]